MNLQKVINNYSKRDRALTLLLTGVIGLTLLFVGCTKVINGIKGISTAKTVYSEGLVGNLPFINPLFSEFSSSNRQISQLIYSGLTKYNPETKTFEPDLATLEITEEGTKYTFTLKEDLEWHDGEEVSIEDVYFTYQTVIKNEEFKNKVLQENLRGIEINIVADNQIEFTLPKANSFFTSVASTGILPKHIYKDVPIAEIGVEINEDRLIGTGPYKFNSLEQINQDTTQVTLKYNKKYQGEEYKIKEVRFFIFPSEQLLLEAQNTLNSIPNLTYDYLDQIDTNRFKTSEYILPQYTALFMNTESGILSETAVRQALQKGASKKALSDELPSKQIISKAYFWFEVIDKISPPDNQPVKEALYAAGWSLNDNGIREKDDTLLKLELIAPIFSTNESKNEDTQKLVQHLQKSYADLGIAVTANFYESEVFAKLLNSKSYDLAIFGHNLGNNFDSYSFWHSSQGGQNGFNLSNYKSVAADKLLEELRTTQDPAKRDELIVQINKKLIEDSPAVFLYTDKHVFVFDNKVKNRKLLSSYAFPSDVYYNMHEWQINN